ncbi:MAG: hypothetical protein GXO00_01875 [Candidatus Diapherotrites archaeon]|nr:hypothetical protein [Candidatus Diapherotrites archaeon]
MKLVYIHGLGANPTSPIAEKVAKDLSLELVTVEHSSLTKRAGWAKKILNAVAEQIPKEEHILMGHSLGGLLSLYLQNLYTRALVLLAPALGLNIGVRLTIQADILKKGFFYFESDNPVEMDREDVSAFFRLMKEAPLPRKPFVMIVGEEDHLLDLNAVLRFFRKSKERNGWYVELLHTGHLFTGREEEVAEIIKNFLKLYIL